MLRLLLVRHGVTVWNQERRRSGHADILLSAEGEEQAARVAERLADEPLDGIWSSDLCRARHTAERIAAPHGLPVRCTPLLRERSHGSLEGLLEDEIRARADAASCSEDPAAMYARVSEALQRIRGTHGEGTVVVAAHLGPLRMMVCRALGLPIEARGRFCLENASLSILEFDGDTTRLRLLNDTSHLAP